MAAAMASHAHDKLMDQDFADWQRLRDEEAIARQLAKTLSREIADQRLSDLSGQAVRV